MLIAQAPSLIIRIGEGGTFLVGLCFWQCPCPKDGLLSILAMQLSMFIAPKGCCLPRNALWVWHQVGVPSKLFQELLTLLGAALSPKAQGVACSLSSGRGTAVSFLLVSEASTFLLQQRGMKRVGLVWSFIQMNWTISPFPFCEQIQILSTVIVFSNWIIPDRSPNYVTFNLDV